MKDSIDYDYARSKSRETNRWCVIGYQDYRRNMPLLSCKATDTFAKAVQWYNEPRGLCIARNGVIMVWRKE